MYTYKNQGRWNWRAGWSGDAPLPFTMGGGGARGSNVPFQSQEFSTLDGMFIVENTLSAWSQLNYWHNIVPNMGFTSAQKAN